MQQPFSSSRPGSLARLGTACLLAGVLPCVAAVAVAAVPEGAGSGSYTTADGHTIEIERQRHEGEAGSLAVVRTATVTDADGELMRESGNVRYRTAEGDVGRIRATRAYTQRGSTHTVTRGAERDAEAQVDARRARTVRDAGGDVTHRRVDRVHREADGSAVLVTRRAHADEAGAHAQRRVVRSTADGGRTVSTQRVRAPRK